MSALVGAVGVTAALLSGRLSGGLSADDAALAKAARQSAQGDRPGALATLLACVKEHKDGTGCRCAEKGAELAVDLARYDDAWTAMKWALACQSPTDQGLRAEALVGQGRTDDGMQMATAVLAGTPGEPHASFAKAWALSRSGSPAEALPLAEAAVKAGRGVPALLLLATLREGGKDAAGTRAAIAEAARLAPGDPRVAYNQGVVEQGQHHYREAREAYLHALALDPKLADARYQLAVLTHSIKADDEARHHLEELIAIAPDDPRIASLRTAIEAK